MIILRVVKEYTSCTSIKQNSVQALSKTLFKQIVTEDEILAFSSSFSLEEVVVYVHHRVL